MYNQVSSRSKRIGALKRNTEVYITERIGKSNRVEQPIKGWIRSTTNDGFATVVHMEDEVKTKHTYEI